MKIMLELLAHRFGEELTAPEDSAEAEAALTAMAGRRSHRRFTDRPVGLELLKLLSAIALSAPTKSDLQQRDIVLVRDPAKKAALADVVSGQDWVAKAPELIVFCGNNKRQRQIHAWRGRPFVNDHLDAFFNAAVDAGIAMQAFVTAAELVGLGCSPISGIRNDCPRVSALLELPEYVFPVVGLGVGWPAREGYMSLRLPLSATVHVDTFRDDMIEQDVDAYDARRLAVHGYATQRQTERFGVSDRYTWSEDKARQYASPEREGFGAFVKSKGFKLE